MKFRTSALLSSLFLIAGVACTLAVAAPDPAPYKVTDGY